MNLLTVATFFLLIVFSYINRDVFAVGKEKLAYLFIAAFSIAIAFLLFTSFLTEFVGIFFFLFALFLLIGSLRK
jgi:hypothetical protein